jgi:hypothetical protein
MTSATFMIDFSDLNLSVSQIESVLGYDETGSEEHFRNLIGKALGEASRVCSIKAEYRIFGDIIFNEADKSAEIDGINLSLQKIIYGQIKKSVSAALFLCTAGEEIGKLSRNSMRTGDILEGYIYDVVGSEIVEAAADIMQTSLEDQMGAAGRNITNRFSPGYCGWDVAEQHKLFKLIPGNWCGIKLTDSALMSPEKSISGIIGIGENVKRLPYKCNLCNMKDCIYKRRV